MKNKGQVSLELATAFICIFILLLASVKLSTWVIGKMVVRQEAYEKTRVEAGGGESMSVSVYQLTRRIRRINECVKEATEAVSVMRQSTGELGINTTSTLTDLLPLRSEPERQIFGKVFSECLTLRQEEYEKSGWNESDYPKLDIFK